MQNDDDSVKNRDPYAMKVYNGDSYSGGLLYCVSSGEVEDDIHGDRDNQGNSSIVYLATTCPSGDPHP
ncbi:MAG: hypothetical protein ACRDVM_02280 [Acidimicrobiia bacterium]